MASDSDEAMTTDELQDPSSSSATTTTPAAPAKATPQRNAFTALMAPKPSSSSSSSSSFAAAATTAAATLATTSRSHAGGMGLGAYIRDPAAFPPSVIIYQNADFVAIHDKFPKATVHALLLPRSSAHSLLHPFDAFRDAAFLESVRHEVRRLRGLVARELQRRLGVHSRAERRRQAVLNGDEAPTSRDSAGHGGKSKKDDDDDDDGDGDGAVPLPSPLLPPGRDWDKEVICGVHAVPSMSHLHVHVLSRDMHSGTMRHRKHYNSFTTPFLVDLDAFSPKPGEHQAEGGNEDGGGGGGGGWLEEEDPRRQGHLRRDLRCWRCGKGFGNQFKKLKDHLEEEFVSWRSE